MLFYNWYLLGVKTFQAKPSKQDLGTDRLGDLFTLFFLGLPSTYLCILLVLLEKSFFYQSVSKSVPFLKQTGNSSSTKALLQLNRLVSIVKLYFLPTVSSHCYVFRRRE